MSGWDDLSNMELYIVSFYYTVTTITTVGYGDIFAHNIAERLLGGIFKIIGVIGFSFASGALTSIITNLDAAQAKLQEKMSTLQKI